MNDLKSKAIHAFSWSLADKIVNHIGSLLVTMYLARLIGPEGYGLIGMLTIFMVLTDSVVSGGFAHALVQRSKDLTVDDENTVFYINIGWGLLMYTLLFFAAPWIAEFYRHPELTLIARVLFLTIIINSFAVVVRAKLTIQVDFKSPAIINTIAMVFSAALGLWLATAGYGYWALVWMGLCRALCSSMAVWWFCRWVPQWRFSVRSFRLLFKFGSNLMLAGFVASFVNNLYIALIGRFYNAVQVGFYTQASNMSNTLYGFVSSSLQGVTYPIMTSIKDDRERLINIYKQLISITMLVCLPMLIGFASVANDFVHVVLGETWLPAVPVLVALCLARTVTPISAINMNILNAVGRSDLFLKVDLSKLPMTLGALYLALPYGIEGIAWASVVTSFIAFFINAYFPGKMFGFGGLAQLRIAMPYIVASAVMFGVLSLLPWAPSLGAMATKVLIGAVIYSLTVWAIGDPWSRKFSVLLRQRFVRP
ncbi:MAG TPA: flippase [Legionella sp.]|nr:flippase [Legionella sp.]